MYPVRPFQTSLLSSGARALLCLFLVATFLMLTSAARAADFAASNEAELVDAITLVNGAGVGVHTITLTADINLTAPLPSLSNTAADEITLAGDGFTLTGDGTSAVLQISSDVTAVIENLTVTGGAGTKGGGIQNQGDLTVRQSTITGNEAASGAGIHSEPFEGLKASLSIEASTISGNSASSLGGGLLVTSNSGQSTADISDSTISNNRATDLGGGLLSSGQSGKTDVTIVRTTIAGNESGLGGGIFNNGNGGEATLTISDSTLSGNSAVGSGGGLTNNGNTGTAIATLVNVTLSGNSAKNGGGLANTDTAGTAVMETSYVTIAANTAQFGDAVFNVSGAEYTARGTILAHGAGNACYLVGGTFTSAGYNLSTDESCGLTESGDLQGVSSGLTPLALNAPGATETMALSEGSPALGAIPPGAAECGGSVTSDQRGVVRPLDGGCEIGAYEAGDEIIQPPDECVPPYAPATEEALNEAIACVNAAGTGTHVITLAADMTLTGPTTPFNNAAADEVQVEGDGFTVDGDGTGTVFSVSADTAVAMHNLTITGGAASAGPSNDQGGGIYNQGDLSLTAVSITNSSAESGGGLYSEGSVMVEASTFSGNSANGAGGGAYIVSDGGTSTFFVGNVTFSGNTAAQGGAIAADATTGSADIGLGFVTLSGNSAGNGSALFANSGSTFTIGSSIVDGDPVSDQCVTNGGSFVSVGYNISSDASCNLSLDTDLANTDPGLAALALNAPGTTATHALLPSSPAINHIPNAANGCGDRVTTDQRGEGRPFPGGGMCDVGAYEAQFDPDLPPGGTFGLYLPIIR